MSKQRCGTCRFFQEAPLAGSGWCHHPLRRTTSDLLLMVRKNELACRDGWSHSLWEPGVWEPENDRDAREAEAHYAGRPMAPANEREIASAMRASGPRPAEGHAEDRVLSEMGLPPGEDADPPYPAVERHLDSRSALVRARENIRERRRVEPRAELSPEPAPRSHDAALPAVPRGGAGATAKGREPDATGRDAGAGGPATWESDNEDLVGGAGLADARAEWDEDDEADPFADAGEALAVELPEAEHPASGRSVARGLFGGFGRFLTDVYGRTSRAAHAEPATPAAGIDAPESVAESGDEFDDDRVEPAGFVTDPVWAGDPEAEFDTMVQRLGARTADRVAEASVAPAGGTGGRGEPGNGVSHRAVPEARDDDATDASAAGDAATHWGAFDLDGDFGGAMVVPSPDLAPDLPRVCRTCRDFRPAEHGGRGWCANRWAFTHRRVVDGNDAAPCEASYGSWWLPVDDAWMAVGDVSEHGRPTPLLDQWLPGHREEERQRRGT